MINKCENCGGKILFNPKDKGNTCVNCSSIFPIEYNYAFKKKPFEENVELETDNLVDSLDNLKCSSCGANILLSKYQLQNNCPYCGSSVLVKEKQKKLMYIDTIIPFSFGKAEALNKFKTTLNKRFYAKKSIFKKLTKENIHGAYVNAFVFDMSTQSSYSGLFSYTRTVTDSDGKSSTKTYYKNVSGVFDKAFANITVEANSNLEQKEFHEILPFDYASAVDFKEDFLNGYMLEYQDKMFNDCVGVAQKIMTGDIKRSLLAKYGCEKIERITLDTHYTNRRYNYCLLPTYFISSVVNDRQYKVVMNGQSGKIGKMPTDKLRVFLTFLIICVGIVGLILLITFF